MPSSVPAESIILNGMADVFERKRRWFQHAGRWPLVFAMLLAIPGSWFSMKMAHAWKQKALIEEIENMGGLVWYDYQFDADGSPAAKAPQPPGPPWLRRLLGDDFFMNVVKLDLTQTEIPDAGLAHLKDLTTLQSLSLGEKITDAGLKHIEGLPQLHTANLRATQVTDAGLAYLKVLPQLQSLNLMATQITDAGLADIEALGQLQLLDLSDTKVTDAGLEYLKELPKLQSLDLRATKVTEIGVEGLERALPNCSIKHSPKKKKFAQRPAKET